MNIRQRIELAEHRRFIKESVFSDESKGREVPEKAEDFRTCFMIDRDRIIHSKSFRRLKHKTQVYIRTTGDHYRTRLTHTLEVSQIGRTIARGININEDLVEAITLAHDIGHVAFAHNGEDALNELLPGGFKHYEQSVRVLKRLERQGKGLNLTFEVLEGILNHSGINPKAQPKVSLEAQIAKYSDKIAYVNHDIDDSIRAGILVEEDLPSEYLQALGSTHSQRIDTLVRDCVLTSLENIEKGEKRVGLSPKIQDALMGLRKFMFQEVYLGERQLKEKERATFIIKELFAYYMDHLSDLPPLYQTIAQEESKERAVADYIAGMTDDFAIHEFRNHFVPGYRL